MDDLLFRGPFNRIFDILSQLNGDVERLCAMELCLQ